MAEKTAEKADKKRGDAQKAPGGGKEPKTETFDFQSEARQLLSLVVHSLYSNPEIFLRELISNASDAADRLRFEALSDPALYGEDPELKIRVIADAGAGTLTISDNGIGMSRRELIDSLGTIANSGTAKFLAGLSGDQRRDAQLIGQFGVGFYSAFMVAKRIEVLSRRAGKGPASASLWGSTGEGNFQMQRARRHDRGTDVILHLGDQATEFLDELRLRTLIQKYSDHIALPIMLRVVANGEGAVEKEKEKEEEKGKETKAEAETATESQQRERDEGEQVNQATALWRRPRKEIETGEYEEFYRRLARDFEAPLAWSHNRVEGKLDYASLLFIPARRPPDLWQRETVRGLKLYVQRVFILDDAEQFLPMYLRFIKGVVDTDSLPLNVSREILQQSPTTRAMRTALTRRVLDTLDNLAAEEPEKYQGFWDSFGLLLKEGVGETPDDRERLVELLRFASTHEDRELQDQSLADYLVRKGEAQDKIYYLLADNFMAAKHSPQLEGFRDKGIEVLLLSDRLDDWMMSQLGEYQGAPLQDVARGELNLGGDVPEVAGDHQALLDGLAKHLGEQVSAVRVGSRLRESAACLVVNEGEVSTQMRRILDAAGRPVAAAAPILEVNPDHPLAGRFTTETDEDLAADLAAVLLGQAQLTDGTTLEDPAGFVRRMNRLLGHRAEG